MSLVERVLDLIFPPRESEREVRAASPDALLGAVAPVLLPGTIPVTALLPYQGLVKSAVIEAKYHDNRAAQALLGEALAEYLLEFSSDEGALAGKLALVPIPLSAKRLKERGYNQVERICESAMSRLEGAMTLMPHALTRVRDTAPQTRLGGEERRQNMHDAFASTPNLDTTYTYIVVDDVITTGATMESAVAALQASGASVVSLALAR